MSNKYQRFINRIDREKRDAKEQLDDLGILADTILVTVDDNGKFIELENDSNGYVVYHKDSKELKKIQKLLGDL
jgi:arylsulfatase A-like enzyme|tara:strand:- start:380 stop:601 length:222 start_codon:yes stop_codon:yes gene_type:complete